MCVILLWTRLFCGVEGHSQAGYTQTRQVTPCNHGPNCNKTTIEYATESITRPEYRSICPDCNNPTLSLRETSSAANDTRGPPSNLPTGPIVVPSLDPRIEETPTVASPTPENTNTNNNPPPPAQRPAYQPMSRDMVANLLGMNPGGNGGNNP